MNPLNQILYLYEKKFYLKIVILILICHEYFHMTKITRARCPNSVKYNDLCSWPWVFDPGFKVLDMGSQLWGLVFWILGPRSLVLGHALQVPGTGSWTLVHSAVITNCKLNTFNSYIQFDNPISVCKHWPDEVSVSLSKTKQN